MASKFTYDTDNRLFILNSGVTSLDAQTEFYAWVKYDWLTDPDLNKFKFPIESIGGDSLGGGVTISPYYKLLYGWRIAPPAADTTIVVVGNIITTEGDSPFTDTAGAWHHDFRSIVSANSLTAGGTSAADLWTTAIEGSLTAEEVLRLIASAVAGKLAGAGTSTITIRDVNDTKDRITASVDGSGNRTSVTTDAS